MDHKTTNINNFIQKKEFRFLKKKIYSEEFLLEVSKIIISFHNYKDIIFALINQVSNNFYNKNFDWNVGSILQHSDPKNVIEEFNKIEKKSCLYESIGISWVFGEFNIKHPKVISYLYDTIEKTKNSEAWWRAAFSLEKLEMEDAVNILKRNLRTKNLMTLEEYLNNVSDKKSIIGILIHSNNKNIEKIIYPKIKRIFLTSHNTKELINCCWVIGRLRLIDKEIFEKMTKLIKNNNYELKYYTFFSLQENVINSFRPLMEKHLYNKDPLIRKMAVRGLSQILDNQYLEKLRGMLYNESNESVISEITKTIYSYNNRNTRNVLKIEHQANENGSIIDESDKWYADPSIYNIFSESEDSENLCFDIICTKIKKDKISVINPIDLAAGTGRMLDQITQKIPYKGILYGVDLNKKMYEFLNKKVKRQKIYINNVKMIQCSIKNAPKIIKSKSSFIISSFGFPSKISDRDNCLEELKSVNELLTNDGVFVTIGWDETFNDELNIMWFKYIPDNINTSDFENWRSHRSQKITSPRNCGLHWLKKGLNIPLEFSSLKESVIVMSHLFGRDAAEYIIQNNKRQWNMSLGITYDTKKDIEKIIKVIENARN